ncbi:hypothetical protein GCM10009827_025060 [Dactylosporangium maewongense]|uniref:Transcriptional regulator n=1 Tax=Dactylosporangium maewongense TaxID=634393 RepID=A0ABN2A3F1_9ACTN
MSVANTGVTPQAGPCDDDCGIRDLLARLGDRWTVLVQGMAHQARDGADREALEAVADLAMRAWPAR